MAEPVIRIMCPNLSCRRILAVPISARGKIVKCGGCHKNIRVPQTAGDVSRPADAPKKPAA
jgi:hypothetical protein